jgi:hypothetical protein
MTIDDAYFTGVFTALGGLVLGWWIDRSLITITAADEKPPTTKL